MAELVTSRQTGTAGRIVVGADGTVRAELNTSLKAGPDLGPNSGPDVAVLLNEDPTLIRDLPFYPIFFDRYPTGTGTQQEFMESRIQRELGAPPVQDLKPDVLAKVGPVDEEVPNKLVEASDESPERPTVLAKVTPITEKLAAKRKRVA